MSKISGDECVFRLGGKSIDLRNISKLRNTVKYKIYPECYQENVLIPSHLKVSIGYDDVLIGKVLSGYECVGDSCVVKVNELMMKYSKCVE